MMMPFFARAAALLMSIWLMPNATLFAQEPPAQGPAEQAAEQVAPDVAEVAADQNSSDAAIQAAAKVVQRSIDASRANNLERWLACFSKDAVFVFGDTVVLGTYEFRRNYSRAKRIGWEEFTGRLEQLEVLDSGWTGERVYVRQLETYSEGHIVETYAEYKVKNGKIVEMFGAF